MTFINLAFQIINLGIEFKIFRLECLDLVTFVVQRFLHLLYLIILFFKCTLKYFCSLKY